MTYNISFHSNHTGSTQLLITLDPTPSSGHNRHLDAGDPTPPFSGLSRHLDTHGIHVQTRTQA